MEWGGDLSGAVGWRSFGVFYDAHVKVVVFRAVLVVVFVLLTVGSCPEVGTIVIIFLFKLGRDEGGVVALRSELEVIFLSCDDLCVGGWTRMRDRGCVWLVVMVGLGRCRKALSWV